MNKFFNKSAVRLVLRTRVRHRTLSQLSQLSEPSRTDDIQRESWRSVEGLVRCDANYVPLSPISFLERSADVFRDRTSVVYGSVKYTWEETHRRCVKFASALAQLGISRGDLPASESKRPYPSSNKS
ncbi:hypothetical protein Tco_0549598 [Tanacetum coccineum]